MDLYSTFLKYWEFPFIRYAFIVGILISLCASLLGVNLVLKRMSFMGDGLSHVAFGALAIAVTSNISNNMLVVMPVTIGVAILLLGNGKRKKIKGDAAIAMMSVGALAIGYLILNVFPGNSGNISGDVCSTLFGSTSMVTLSGEDMWLSVILSFIVLTLFVLFYNRLFAITFDEDFAKATGTRTGIYRISIAIVTAIVIVLAMKLVGSLLISALIVFPTLSATRVVKSYKMVVIYASVCAVVTAVVGMILSLVLNTPVGATIVAVDIIAFGVSAGVGAIHEFF